jgi:hypothetical protein
MRAPLLRKSCQEYRFFVREFFAFSQEAVQDVGIGGHLPTASARISGRNSRPIGPAIQGPSRARELFLDQLWAGKLG